MPRFHSLDGSCTDPAGFGKVFDTYARLTPADYCNGRNSLRCKKIGSDTTLPNPRVVSLLMQKTMDKVPFNDKRTRLMADFGQFVTHDMIQDRMETFLIDF